MIDAIGIGENYLLAVDRRYLHIYPDCGQGGMKRRRVKMKRIGVLGMIMVCVTSVWGAAETGTVQIQVFSYIGHWDLFLEKLAKNDCKTEEEQDECIYQAASESADWKEIMVYISQQGKTVKRIPIHSVGPLNVELPAGEYRLQARKQNAPTWKAGVYRDAESDVETVSVSPGKTSYCRFSLRNDLVAVRGRIVDSAHKALPDFPVVFRKLDYRGISELPPPDVRARTDHEGYYRFPGIIPTDPFRLIRFFGKGFSQYGLAEIQAGDVEYHFLPVTREEVDTTKKLFAILARNEKKYNKILDIPLPASTNNDIYLPDIVVTNLPPTTSDSKR